MIRLFSCSHFAVEIIQLKSYVLIRINSTKYKVQATSPCVLSLPCCTSILRHKEGADSRSEPD